MVQSEDEGCRKRKASTNNNPDDEAKKAKSEEEAETNDDDDEDDDDGASCPICFEPWTNSGDHRIASLKCGHFFGKACIERYTKYLCDKYVLYAKICVLDFGKQLREHRFYLLLAT